MRLSRLGGRNSFFRCRIDDPNPWGSALRQESTEFAIWNNRTARTNRFVETNGQMFFGIPMIVRWSPKEKCFLTRRSNTDRAGKQLAKPRATRKDKLVCL